MSLATNQLISEIVSQRRLALRSVTVSVRSKKVCSIASNHRRLLARARVSTIVLYNCIPTEQLLYCIGEPSSRAASRHPQFRGTLTSHAGSALRKKVAAVLGSCFQHTFHSTRVPGGFNLYQASKALNFHFRL